jgi:DNA-binding winged helix-turn-helix (wHTH) protein
LRGAYRFGPFQLDVLDRRLSRGADVIPLRLKVFETLRVLVENAGPLVTKQELLDSVWPATAAEENNLNHCYYHGRSNFARGAVKRFADLFRTAADLRQKDFQSPTLLAQSLRVLGQLEGARAANQ